MEVSEKTAGAFRKYFIEYVVLALTIAVITLFGLYKNLNDFVTNQLMERIQKNTNVIEQNNYIIQSFKNK